MHPLRSKLESGNSSSSLAVLYQKYALVILTYIRRHVPSKEDAEDTLLEVFLAALESAALSKMSENEQLAWLKRVAHNKFIDYHRRAMRRPVVALDEAADTLYEDDSYAPDQVVLRHEEQALLHARLATLSELQQEVLRLRFASGLRCGEIARRLQRSESAIYMTLSRSLNYLRGIYKSRREDE